MLAEYLRILLFGGVCFGLAMGLVGLAFLRGPRRPDAAKTAPYECGFPPLSAARAPVDVRFVVVAILFVVFDVEIVLLFPWAVHLYELSWAGFGSVVCFLTLVTTGLVYEWARGALNWLPQS